MARKLTLFLVCAFEVALISQTAWGDNVAEVQLVSKLDDQRGYCIDIRGHKERAKVQRGLQAHTCYSYQGQIGVDQAFDARLVATGIFSLPAFDVCMEAENSSQGSRLILTGCAEHNLQKFDLNSANEIRLVVNNELCLAVNDGKSKEGGGGTPVHLMRRLTLEYCATTEDKYKHWLISN
ncbi:RICIN domain-containing protein [Alphaproteobacteria bacterium]|nr:RICIN domain-containing protein [Alphaproteobacteria bacterium]